MGSPGLALAVSKLLDQEEEIYEQETEIALLESRIQEVDEAARQRVAQLRHAVIDLSQERERLLVKLSDEGLDTDRHAPPEHQPGQPPSDEEAMIKDINFQIRALESRLMEVTANREEKLAELNRKLKALRQQAVIRESRLAELENEVERHVSLVREQCERAPDLGEQLRLLDYVKQELVRADARRG
jgi:predicted  nucleic acid-binding Zn-ribbon protein